MGETDAGPSRLAEVSEWRLQAVIMAAVVMSAIESAARR